MIQKANECELQPLPGCMVLKMEGYFEGEMTGGLIEVPEVARGQIHQIGVIVIANPDADDTRKQGFDFLPGERVLMPNYSGRAIDDEHQVYRCCDALALVYSAAVLGAQSQEIERCRYCGAARTGTDQRLLLDNDVCPRCHKNERGVYKDPDAVDVSDDEVEAFARQSGMFR